MMFRLLVRLTLPVIVVCAALIALAPLVYQREVSPPPAWDAFGFAACTLPCWAGITVGTTPFPDALAVAQANIPALTQFANSGSQINLWGNTPPLFFSGLIYYAQGNVRSIRLDVKLPPDYMIRVLGLPDCVFTGVDVRSMTGVNIVYWVRDGLGIAAWIDGSARALFTSSETIYALWLDVNGSNVCDQKTTTPWRGAAAWWQYLRWQTALQN